MIKEPEQSILRAIIDLLTIKQVLVVHVRNTGNVIKRDGKIFFGRGLNQRGAPDLIFSYYGVPVACEVKSADGRLRPEQAEWLKRWADPPNMGYSFVARSVEDVMVQLGKLDSRFIGRADRN